MSGRLARAVAGVLLLAAAVGVAAGAPPDAATATARGQPGAATPGGNLTRRIVAVHPDPVAPGDRGEFVVLSLPADHPPLTLTDGESTVRIPPDATGRVAVAADPEAAGRLTRAPVVAADRLALANGGERLRLGRGGRQVGTVAYGPAEEGETWHRDADAPRGTGGSGVWRPLGYDPRPATAHRSVQATAFVLPDAPALPVATLREADRRLLLAGYTFRSRRAAEALIAARRRGVEVRVLLEGEPVGGRSRRTAQLLDRLAAAGVDVRVVGGPNPRFRYHHAKYAVVDDAALVLTENWKPAGTGGHSSRGWGVRLADAGVAADLAALFRRDAGARDARPWGRYRRGRTFERAGAANGSYPSRIDPRQVSVDRVRVLTAPGPAAPGVVGAIDNATERVDALQPTVERTGAFVDALRRAARRGVRVRLLLSGAWYVAEQNRRIVAALNDHAEREGLPLEARVADPRGRYGKVHAKGAVVDGGTVLLGSLNWNRVSARENRELVVALEGEAVADYYTRAFEADWRGGGRRLPAGVLLGAAVAAGVAVAVARRTVRFRE